MRRAFARFYALFVVLALALVGCGNLRVDAASPRPNVDLPPPITPARLELDASIQDAFVIPRTDAVNEVPVNSWRATLTHGFENGFKGGSTGLVLQLRRVELSFAPAALGTGGTAAVRAHIRFSAALSDAAGHELGRVTGEVDAHDAATAPTPEAMTANASQAVEAMYEGIAFKIAEAAQAAVGGKKD